MRCTVTAANKFTPAHVAYSILLLSPQPSAIDLLPSAHYHRTLGCRSGPKIHFS